MNKKKKLISTKELITEMRHMLKEPKLTLENMIFSEMDNDDVDGNAEQCRDNCDGMDNDADNGKGMRSPSNPSVSDSISQIRKIALGAISQISDSPTSPEYDLLKKIWNMCDKGIESNSVKKHSNTEE